MEVIPKVRLFVWRWLSDAPPLRAALRRRGIDVDPICERCGEGEETLEHAFRDCRWVEFLWRTSPLRLTFDDTARQQSVINWICQIKSVNSSEFHRLFATILWTIWYARNLLIFEHKELSHAQCIKVAMKNLLYAAPHPPITNPCAPAIETIPGFWKVQCDAAFQSDQQVGIGIVITNDSNNLVGCGYKIIQGAIDVEAAECIALKEGILLAKELHVKSIILETDCQFKLSKNAADLSVTGGVIHIIKKIISTSFDQVKFSWTRRIANSVADRLAKYALAHQLVVSFSECIPNFDSDPTLRGFNSI